MTTPPIGALSAFLKALGDGYAVSKNPDVWASLARGGDWDLIVADVRAARHELWSQVGPPNHRMAREYVDGSYYDWGHIDLLPGIRWRGIELASADEMIDRASRNAEGVRVASPGCQLIAACVFPLVSYGSYRVRYSGLAESSVARSEAGQVLRGHVAGSAPQLVDDILRSGQRALDTRHHRQLRRAIVRGAVSRVGMVQVAQDSCAFAVRELAYRGGRTVSFRWETHSRRRDEEG